MTAAFLIALRETLEASLLVGIVLGQLHVTKQVQYKKYVWNGVIAGSLFSLYLATFFQQVLGGFSEHFLELYEGAMMIIAAFLVSWMIWWLHRNSSTRENHIREKIDDHVLRQFPIGIFTLIFLAISREGIETVIFLQAAMFSANAFWVNLSALFGIVLAIALAYFVFKSIIALSVQTFFRAVHGLLVIFAAGLVSHGVHELQEAGLLPIYKEHVWNTNGWLHEDGFLGSVAHSLLGYNGDPSLLEVSSYVTYILIISGVWYYSNRQSKTMV